MGLHAAVGIARNRRYDRELCALVMDVFVRELMRSYRWRAKYLFGLSSVNDAFPGTVTVIQRFDSALRLNVHFHTACYDAAARTPKTRVVDPGRLRPDERVAVVAGFNVHAVAAIDGRDRKRLERVCRYLTRPPIATARLAEVGDELRYELKKVWHDGTCVVTLEPYDLLALS